MDLEAEKLQGKNIQVENAVRDLIRLINGYHLDSHIERVSDEAIEKLEKHFNHFMYPSEATTC